MNTVEQCPHCAIPLTYGFAPTETGDSREIKFCLRCKYKQLGKIFLDKRIEWNADFYIQLAWAERLTLQQVKTLREVDSRIAAQPLAQLLQDLRDRQELLLGPFFRKTELDSALNSLQGLGFVLFVKMKY